LGLPDKTRVSEDTVFVQLDHRPYTDRFLCDLHLQSLELVIVKEVAILARVELISEEGQQSVVELEL